ncbi:MAG: hypothetical protein Kow0037_32320 [Calditrichia bacterium]
MESKAGMAQTTYFEELLRKYFRRTPPLPTQLYLPAITDQPVEVRKKIAKVCNSPEILEMLCRDSHPEVSQVARGSEYWQAIGQFRPLLKLDRAEKLNYIRREDLSGLMVFVLFETDLKIYKEVLLKPQITLKMIQLLRRYVLEREDSNMAQPILSVIDQVLSLRRRRIVQISSIYKEDGEDYDQTISATLKYLLDEDEVVVKSAVNVLKKYPFQQIINHILEKGENGSTGYSPEEKWKLLINLQKFYQPAGKSFSELKELSGTKSSAKDLFEDAIRSAKLSLLDVSLERLNETESIYVITLAHLDSDPPVVDKVKSILNIEELLSLVEDPTFPQAAGIHILELLKSSPSRYVQQRINEIFLKIYERTRHRLREMEMTINAYFDIIFSMLGFPDIQKIRQAFKILDSARRLTQGFSEGNGNHSEEVVHVQQMFDKISRYYQKQLAEIYMDLRMKRIEELKEVLEILGQIKNTPVEILHRQGFKENENPAAYQRLLKSTQTIFRTSLGQYLGRLKELDEMVRRKWVFGLTRKNERELLKKEMAKTSRELEINYKERVGCHLKAGCLYCSKRSCAGLRMLEQTEFFLSEFLDFLEEGVENEENPVEQTV